jgi:hypothetical protein
MAYDPNYSIVVGGHPQAYASNGAALTSASTPVLSYADATAIQAIASTTRTDGMVIVKLDDSTEWIFDAESSASASAWVLVPDAGSGRWLRKFVSTLDLSTTGSATLGANLIGIRDAATIITATTVEGALAEVAQFEVDLGSTANAKGAAKVAIEDAGLFTSAATVEAALAELYQNVKTAQAQVNVPLATAILAAGTPMAAFADSATSDPGITLANSKAVGIRWNNAATQIAIWYGVPMPQDLDDTAAIVLHVLASKTGATSGDATTFTVTAFFQTVGALHDADTDRGGTTTAMTGNATAKTVAELTLSIAGSAVPASPSVLSFSIKPTNGLLGTDDVIVEGLWFEYQRKLLAS